jgi:RNA polymerase sigma factor for flagellar operon FliA
VTVIAEKISERAKNHNNIALRAYCDQKEFDGNGIEDERITQYLPMVHKIVRQVIIYLRPPLSLEDMVSAGTVGLVRAARDFDPSQGAEFKTYAYIRIKGAVLDELKGWSFIPSNLNKRIRDAQYLSLKITGETGVAPTDAELAEKLGIEVGELSEIFENARAQYFISLNGFGDDSPALGDFLVENDTKAPDEHAERKELIRELAEAIQQLPQNLRQIVLLYYQQHLTMKQIADVLELTESRVSQLHASAIFNLSVKLRQWKDGGL